MQHSVRILVLVPLLLAIAGCGGERPAPSLSERSQQVPFADDGGAGAEETRNAEELAWGHCPLLSGGTGEDARVAGINFDGPDPSLTRALIGQESAWENTAQERQADNSLSPTVTKRTGGDGLDSPHKLNGWGPRSAIVKAFAGLRDR